MSQVFYCLIKTWPSQNLEIQATDVGLAVTKKAKLHTMCVTLVRATKSHWRTRTHLPFKKANIPA